MAHTEKRSLSSRLKMPSSEMLLDSLPYARVVNCVVLIILSIVAVALHPSQVRVEKACTRYDPDGTCWHGGPFRAMDFTSYTTSLTQKLDPITMMTAYPVLPDLKDYDNSRAECAVTWSEPPDKQRKLACEIERVPQLWEVPNKPYARIHPGMAGGVDTWFFIWLSLWLGASFAVMYLPGWLDSFKVITLFVWHLIGMVVIGALWLDDRQTNIRLPLNNLLIGYLWMIFTFLVQIYLAHASRDAEPTLNKAMLKTPYRQAGAFAGLGRLMRLGEYVEPGGPPEKEETAPEETMGQVYSMEVFSAGYYKRMLLEGFCMEVAITIPPIIVAVFCMASRLNMDWMVASIFSRSFILFAGIGICYKCIPVLEPKHPSIRPMTKTKTDELEFQKTELGAVLFLLAANFLSMFVYLSIDLWSRTLDRGYVAEPVGLTGFVSSAMIFFMILLLVTVLAYMYGNASCKVSLKLDSHDVQLGMWYAGHFLLLVIRVTMFSFTVSPQYWYGAYEDADVLLDYPVM